jgi:hypothetical protein
VEKSTRKWLSIVVAVLLAVCLLGIAALGSVAYFLYSHIQTAPITEVAAGDRFARERARFAGSQPLVEIRGREDVVVHRPAAAVERGTPLTSLKALVYDDNEAQLVEMSMPFWLIRMLPSGRFSFLSDSGFRIDSERMRLTAEDLEAHGPGLVLDHRDPDGGHILVWTE